MNCFSFSKQMQVVLDGEGSPQLHRGVRKHLARCPTCRTELHELFRFKSLLFNLAEEPARHQLQATLESGFQRLSPD